MLAAVDRRTEAITELGHAVEAAPRDPGILLAAAWISARCGDATSAQVFATRARDHGASRQWSASSPNGEIIVADRSQVRAARDGSTGRR
jgi:hypothetical protein